MSPLESKFEEVLIRFHHLQCIGQRSGLRVESHRLQVVRPLDFVRGSPCCVNAGRKLRPKRINNKFTKKEKQCFNFVRNPIVLLSDSYRQRCDNMIPKQRRASHVRDILPRRSEQCSCMHGLTAIILIVHFLVASLLGYRRRPPSKLYCGIGSFLRLRSEPNSTCQPTPQRRSCLTTSRVFTTSRLKQPTQTAQQAPAQHCRQVVAKLVCSVRPATADRCSPISLWKSWLNSNVATLQRSFVVANTDFVMYVATCPRVRCSSFVVRRPLQCFLDP